MLKSEAVHMEGIRIYRNYATRKDEIGRPNPLVLPTSNEQERLRLLIDVEKIKSTFLDYCKCCHAMMCNPHNIRLCCMPWLFNSTCCAICSCNQMHRRANLVEQAAHAHTLILRERTLLYKVTPYNDWGNFEHGFFSQARFCCPCHTENLTRARQSGVTVNGIDGYIAKRTGADIKIEQSIPLELVDSIELKYVKGLDGRELKKLVVHVNVPNFSRVCFAIIDFPLNWREFIAAVENRKDEILSNNREESFETTDPQLYQDFVKYLTSCKKVSFADYMALATPEAVGVSLAPVQQSMDRGNDIAGQLISLKQLYEAGTLDAEEFKLAKQKLIGGGGGGDPKVDERSKPTAPPLPTPPLPAPVPLPPGWQMHHDQSGRMYYYNETTQESRWTRP